MALADAEKTQVRFYLGQGSLFRYKNPRLEGIWGALDADAEAILRKILGQLAVVDEQLFGHDGATSRAISAAGIKAVEEIQFAGNGGAVTTELRRLGRNLVGRLSALIGVPIYADVFSDNGWPGDSYSKNGLGGGNGGNMIPLG